MIIKKIPPKYPEYAARMSREELEFLFFAVRYYRSHNASTVANWQSKDVPEKVWGMLSEAMEEEK